MTVENWFQALGRPVHPDNKRRALQLLEDNDYNPQEAALVLSVVVREIEHDEPERAQKYMRSYLRDQWGYSETFLMVVLSTLCARGLTVESALENLREIESLEAKGPHG